MAGWLADALATKSTKMSSWSGGGHEVCVGGCASAVDCDREWSQQLARVQQHFCASPSQFQLHGAVLARTPAPV